MHSKTRANTNSGSDSISSEDVDAWTDSKALNHKYTHIHIQIDKGSLETQDEVNIY